MHTAFWKKLTLFAGPLALLVGVPTVVLVASGELTPVDSVIVRQARGDGVLFGPAYTNLAKPLKFLSTQRRQPEVIALGSSRVMQFRASFFAAPQAFYNAGGAVNALPDISRFLDSLRPSAQPRVVVLGLDQWFFNPRWTADEGVPDFDGAVDAWAVVQGRWKGVYEDLMRSKIDLRRMWDAGGAVGLSALMKQRGFRDDGSYSYGDLDHCDDCEVGFSDTLQRIASGQLRFEWSDEIDRDALVTVDRFLEAAAAKNLHVVGLLPPFAPTVWSRMRTVGRYRYMDSLRGELPAVFSRRGFALFDFSDPDAIGAIDEEFIDGFHGSERTYLRMLLMMAAATPALEASISRESLAPRLARAGRYTVPETP